MRQDLIESMRHDLKGGMQQDVKEWQRSRYERRVQGKI